jgi:hypothetical protein
MHMACKICGLAGRLALLDHIWQTNTLNPDRDEQELS